MTYLHHEQRIHVVCPHCGCGTIACGVGILVDVPDLKAEQVPEYNGDPCICDFCGGNFVVYCNATASTAKILDMEVANG